MVLRKDIKAVTGILLFLVLAFSFSCEKRGYLFVDCTECTTEEPSTTKLEIKLDNSHSSQAELNIYRGNLEDSILYRHYNISVTSTTVTVPVNNKYTITAKYYIAGFYYIAVDAVTPRVKYDKESCNDPCYYVYDNKVNLRLKY